MARAISASDTVMMPSRDAARCRKVSSLSVERMPSADVRAKSLRFPRHEPAGPERLAGVGRELGLHAEYPRGRSQRLDGRRNAAGEAATAHRHQHREVRGRWGHRLDLLDDLQAGSALPGDDPAVVVGGDQHEAAFLRQVGGAGGALVA